MLVRQLIEHLGQKKKRLKELLFGNGDIRIKNLGRATRRGNMVSELKDRNR